MIMLNRLHSFFLFFIISQFLFSQECVDASQVFIPESPSFSSVDFYELNSDLVITDMINDGIIYEDLILIPIYNLEPTIGYDDLDVVSSYQFNLVYNHQILSFLDGFLENVNFADFYNLNSLPPTVSDVSNGGLFSSNNIVLNDTTSILSIAYATSQTISMNTVDFGTLLYIPFDLISNGCSEIKISDGLIDGQYVFPNQTKTMLISNVDYTNCTNNSVNLCFNCLDNNDNLICDELEIILGCTDEMACNYNPNVTDDDGSCFYPNDCGDCLNPGLIQTIDIPFGWSLFSTFICPFEPGIDDVTNDLVLEDNLVIVKDENGNVYWPIFELNTIGDLENGKAYLIKMDNASSLDISGDTLGYDYPLNLDSGWSYLGYLHQDSYSVEYLFSSTVDNLVIMKDSQGNVYWPMFFINTIDFMNPGEGYQINMSDNISFSYPSPSEEGRYFNDINNYFSNFSNPINTGNNMTIGIPEGVWSEKPVLGDEILVFDNTNLLVGSDFYREEGTVITVWGDDETTFEKDGISIGENLRFYIYNSFNNLLEQIFIPSWQVGTGNYQINGISIASSLSFDYTTEKNIVKVTDLIGREISPETINSFLLFIYDDGTVYQQYILK